MRYVPVFIVLAVFFLIALPTRADLTFNEDVRDEVISLFGVILTPSTFTAASSEQAAFSLYGRTLTAEGEVPDFDEKPRDEIDEMALFLSGRISGMGLTLGFGQGSDFEFSQPLIISLDYKAGLLKENPNVDAAIDFQYTMITLPDEENINISALGFGVFSVTALVSANLLHLLEPYAGVSVNYIYMNSEDEFINVWKPVPKVGLQVSVLPKIRIGGEIQFIDNKYLDSAWMWNLGVSLRLGIEQRARGM